MSSRKLSGPPNSTLGRFWARLFCLATADNSAMPSDTTDSVASPPLLSPMWRSLYAHRVEFYIRMVVYPLVYVLNVLKTGFRVVTRLVLNRGAIDAPVMESLHRSFGKEEGNWPDSSFYARLFPGMELNCYRDLVYWVGKYSLDAAAFLDVMLPLKGPVVAVDLAYLLAAVVIDFDAKHMILPDVYEVTVLDAKFLHFDSATLVSVRELVIKLLKFNGYVGAGGIDPMSMTSTAATVGASTIASNQASTMFRNTLENMVEVRTMLSEEEEIWLKRDRASVYFSKKLQVSHDHAYLAACREVIRHDFDGLHNMRTTTLRNLVLGAGTREYMQYSSNAHICFQFAAVVGKDSERIVTQCLEAVKGLRIEKQRKLKSIEGIEKNRQSLISINNMIAEFKQSRKLPHGIVLWKDTQEFLRKDNVETYDVLVFQDVGYNFTKDDWGHLFRRTGAVLAYGYMCLPWQLIKPDIVDPPGYVYKAVDGMSYLAYHGYCNGYAHKTEAWSTLMQGCVMEFSDFNIGIEFISRVGPMTLVRLYRCSTNEIITRHLELPDYLKSVMILDVSSAYDRVRSEFRMDDLPYFLVREAEFNETVNYALDIPEESLCLQNILLYVRRRRCGISLVTCTWCLSPSMIPAFSLTVYLYVKFLSQDYINIQKPVDKGTYSIAGNLLLKYGRTVRGRILSFRDLFAYRDMFDLLVKDVNHTIWQETTSKI